MRTVSIVIAAAFLLLTSGPGAMAAPPDTVISGGDLPGPTRLAPADADAFARRASKPPRLRALPPQIGEAYSLTSPYWENALTEANDEDGDDAGPVSPEALYYPRAGLARVNRGDEAVWLALDLRQRAILDRYLRLGEGGLLSPTPGALEVTALAAVGGEQIGVAIDGRALPQLDLAELWPALAALAPAWPELDDVTTGSADHWLVFTLTEGRTLQFRYDASARTLSDHLGTEQYSIDAALAELIQANAGVPPGLRQEDATGSPLWWLVAIGGGSVALAAAVWLRRTGNRHEQDTGGLTP